MNQGGSLMKKGWNKNGDSNLNTECPIAALRHSSPMHYSNIPKFIKV
jgi:hypothetical protein